jgi:hypothetical protein
MYKNSSNYIWINNIVMAIDKSNFLIYFEQKEDGTLVFKKTTKEVMLVNIIKQYEFLWDNKEEKSHEINIPLEEFIRDKVLVKDSKDILYIEKVKGRKIIWRLGRNFLIYLTWRLIKYMGDRISVGEDLISVSSEIESILAEYGEAYTLFNEGMRDFLDEGRGYLGTTKENLTLYHQSFEANITKLITILGVSDQYIIKIFEQFNFTDEEIAKSIEQLGMGADKG